MVIKGQEAAASLGSMGSYQEVGENTPGTRDALLSQPGSVSLKYPAGSAPDCLVQIPVHKDPGVCQERIQESLAPAWGSHQLTKNGSGDEQITATERCVKG